ncbi:uncharacterized protein [Argopecten irradians]|uniref:uncharacterized protein n=1 Tax=Argopecten irradians TaxID=31199 RepID=UPI0037221F10
MTVSVTPPLGFLFVFVPMVCQEIIVKLLMSASRNRVSLKKSAPLAPIVMNAPKHTLGIATKKYAKLVVAGEVEIVKYVRNRNVDTIGLSVGKRIVLSLPAFSNLIWFTSDIPRVPASLCYLYYSLIL